MSAFCRDLLRINHMPKGLIKEGCFQRIERDCKLKSTVSYLVPSNDKNDKHRSINHLSESKTVVGPFNAGSGAFQCWRFHFHATLQKKR